MKKVMSIRNRSSESLHSTFDCCYPLHVVEGWTNIENDNLEHPTYKAPHPYAQFEFYKIKYPLKIQHICKISFSYSERTYSENSQYYHMVVFPSDLLSVTKPDRRPSVR